MKPNSIIILISVSLLLSTARAIPVNESERYTDELITALQQLKNEMQILNDGMNKAISQQNSGMTVLYAYYGISCTNQIQKNVLDTSTNWAKGICDGKNSCRGTVHTSVLTDPYYGCAKDFLVVAQCADGKTISDLVIREAQGKQFSLQCQTCTCQ